MVKTHDHEIQRKRIRWNIYIIRYLLETELFAQIHTMSACKLVFVLYVSHLDYQNLF